MISVIMPVRLESYQHCADKREQRFIFAVESFLQQKYKNKELIIIGDNCSKSESIYQKKWKKDSRVKYFQENKGKYFSGHLRQRGIEEAKYKWICYLDSDDFIGQEHLSIISQFLNDDWDWFYYDDFFFVQYNLNKINVFQKRLVQIKPPMKIGTCSIVHKKDLEITWPNGYGHDHKFINELKKYKHKKISTPQYFICHIPHTDLIFNIEDPNFTLRH